MTEPASSPIAPRPKTPVHLWIVAVLAILWHLMAVFDYLATELRLESYMSQFTQEQLDYFYGFPSWVVAAWAIAVWGGLLASIALLIRRKWAVWLFALSLVGLALTTLYNFVLSDGAAIMGAGAAMFTAVIWIIAIALLLYAWRQAANGVLR